MLLKKIALALFLAIMLAAYFFGGGEKYLSIDLYQNLYETSPLATAIMQAAPITPHSSSSGTNPNPGSRKITFQSTP